jgi:biopolymer transport protein ExbD
VLLVVLIFLMLSTTYSKFTELQVNLPAADAEKLRERPGEIIVAVSSDGRYAVNRKPVDGRSVDLLAASSRCRRQGRDDPVVIISADATAAHQSVVNVLDAARRAGLQRLTFATQTNGARRVDAGVSRAPRRGRWRWPRCWPSTGGGPAQRLAPGCCGRWPGCTAPGRRAPAPGWRPRRLARAGARGGQPGRRRRRQDPGRDRHRRGCCAAGWRPGVISRGMGGRGAGARSEADSRPARSATSRC